MYFNQVPVGGYDRNFSYIIGDEKTREVAVVDPDNLGMLSNIIRKDELEVVAVIVTHEHHDHVVGVPAMVETYQVPVYAHPDARQALEECSGELRDMLDGDVIRIGGLEIEVLHTPGHAAGAVCLLAEDKLITGDTLFVGGCGRCDLAGSDVVAMRKSLLRLAELPDDIEVYPGHDYGDQPFSNIGREKETNCYLLCESQEEFSKKRL